VITKVYDSTLAYDIAKLPINEKEGVIQAHFSQLRKWIDVPRYLLRNPYFRQHLQNQQNQYNEDYQQDHAEINEEQGEISIEESLPDPTPTPTFSPEDDSEEDDDDFSVQLPVEDYHLLEELRRRQTRAQEEIFKLIDKDYSTFLSDSFRVLQESFDVTNVTRETNVNSRINSELNGLTELSNVNDVNISRFTQTDITIPPEEEEEEDDLFNTTLNDESFEGFCPLDYSVDHDSIEEFVPQALSPIMEEPDSYYQLNFSDEFSDKTVDSFEGFDPKGFYIEENYMELQGHVDASPEKEEPRMEMEMNSGKQEPSPRRLRSHGEAPQHDYIMERPLEYRRNYAS
jgi:hypothetical protein